MVKKSTLVQGIENTWKHLEGLLNRKGFNTIILENEGSLRNFIYDSIPDDCVVGLGNSLSSSAMRIRDILLEKGNKVYYNWNGTAYNRSLDTFEEQPRPDFFLTTADRITVEGEFINSEYSILAAKEYSYPKNIIAFSEPDRLSEQKANGANDSDYTVFENKPDGSEVTIALVSFASAS